MKLLSLIKKLGGGPDQWFGYTGTGDWNSAGNQTAFNHNDSYAAPFDGTITKFMTRFGDDVEGSFKFKVLRDKGGGTYEVIYSGSSETAQTTETEYTGYSISVLEGDIIGIWHDADKKFYDFGGATEGIAKKSGDLGLGEHSDWSTDTDLRLCIQAYIES